MTNKLDPFELRLAALNNSSAPKSEIDAAVKTYERLRTARTAVVAEFGEPPPVEAVIAVFHQLCAEAQVGHGMRSAAE